MQATRSLQCHWRCSDQQANTGCRPMTWSCWAIARWRTLHWWLWTSFCCSRCIFCQA